MKKSFLLLFAFIFISSTNFAQELALVVEDGKAGYINKTGELVIPTKFKNAGKFSEGYAAATENGKVWGVINTKGDWSIAPEYDKVKTFNSGIIVVLKEDRWRYVDASNKELEAPATDKVFDFNDGVAFYKVEKKIGLIGTDGKVVLKPTYDVMKPFVNGYAKVRNNEKWGMINKKGEVFIEVIYNEVGDYNANGVWVKKGDTFGMLLNNEFYGNPEINKIANFHYGHPLTYARSEKSWGFINNKAEWVVAPKYKKVKAFRKGLAPVLENKLWGYINEKGEMVIPDTFKDAEVFAENGLAPVKSKLWGFIDTSGKLKIKEEYEITAKGFSMFTKNNIKGFHKGLARVSAKKKWGYINEEGELLGGKWYENVELFSE